MSKNSFVVEVTFKFNECILNHSCVSKKEKLSILAFSKQFFSDCLKLKHLVCIGGNFFKNLNLFFLQHVLMLLFLMMWLRTRILVLKSVSSQSIQIDSSYHFIAKVDCRRKGNAILWGCNKSQGSQ